LCSITFSYENLVIMRYMEKYDSTRETTDNNVISLLHLACCTTKDTDTHSDYVCGAYCCFMVIIVRPTRVFVTFIHTLPVL